MRTMIIAPGTTYAIDAEHRRQKIAVPQSDNVYGWVHGKWAMRDDGIS
jgi:hypothetical protein